MPIRGKVAVVTGASSGIGRALAVQLGLRGARVVVAARSLPKLQETSALLNAYGIENLIVRFDVTSDESIRELVETVRAKYGGIDIFVNNAGIGLFQDTVQASQEDVDSIFATNVWGPLKLMKLLGPMMKDGLVVNISSAASKYAPYRQGIYAASKAALDRLTEAAGLEEEARFKTLLVIPDRTDTPFMEHVVGPRENVKLGLKLKFASTEDVALKIARAIEKKDALCYTTSKSRVYALLSVISPGLLKRVIRKTM